MNACMSVNNNRQTEGGFESSLSPGDAVRDLHKLEPRDEFEAAAL